MKRIAESLVDTLDDLEQTYERHLELTYSDETTTLYRFYDQAEQLLYVGITNSPSRRFAEHQDGKEWWPTIASVKLEHFPSRQQALDAERAAIVNEKPLRNIQHNANGWQPYTDGRTADLSPVVAKRQDDSAGLTVLVDRSNDDTVTYGRGDVGEPWVVVGTADEYLQVHGFNGDATEILWYGPWDAPLRVRFPDGSVHVVEGRPSPLRRPS